MHPLPFHYGQRLNYKVALKGTRLMLGLDPNPALIPKLFFKEGGISVLEAVDRYCFFVLKNTHRFVVGVKLQSAFFEQYGGEGVFLMQRLANYAKSVGLIVLLDAKRGDIPSTAEAYAKAYLSDEVEATERGGDFTGGIQAKQLRWNVDAVTIHPFFGFDTLLPFVETAKKNGKGLYVCVKTSNEGSVELQNLAILESENAASKNKTAGSVLLYQKITQGLKKFHDFLLPSQRFTTLQAEVKAGMVGDRKSRSDEETDVSSAEVSSLGVVVGATFPLEAVTVHKVLTYSPMLVPGYGAQGGDESKRLNFCNGLPSLFPISRALMYPWLFCETGKQPIDVSKLDKDSLAEQLALAGQKWNKQLAVA